MSELIGLLCTQCGGKLFFTPTKNIVQCVNCSTRFIYDGKILKYYIDETVIRCPLCGRSDRVKSLYDMYHEGGFEYADLIKWITPPRDDNQDSGSVLHSSPPISHSKRKPVKAIVALSIGIGLILYDIALKSIVETHFPVSFIGEALSMSNEGFGFVFRSWFSGIFFMIWGIIELIVASGKNNSNRADSRVLQNNYSHGVNTSEQKKPSYSSRYQVWKNLFYCSRANCDIAFLMNGRSSRLENLSDFIENEASALNCT